MLQFEEGNMSYCRTFLALLLLVAVSNVVSQEPDPLIDIFPPKWYPGDVLDSTEHSKIEKALKDVDRAGGLLQTRTVSIGLASMRDNLDNPRYHLKDGKADSNMAPEIGSEQTGLMFFHKTSLGIAGVHGVVTYDIQYTEYKVAVMFRVPFNGLSYKNKFNIKVYPKNVPVDRAMVDQMYRHAGPWIAQGYEERNEYGINLRGSMTDNTHARLVVWVDTTLLDIGQGPHFHADCDYKSSAFGNRCWKECSPTGWCWSKAKCKKNKNQCDGQKLTCDTKCKKP